MVANYQSMTLIISYPLVVDTDHLSGPFLIPESLPDELTIYPNIPLVYTIYTPVYTCTPCIHICTPVYTLMYLVDTSQYTPYYKLSSSAGESDEPVPWNVNFHWSKIPAVTCPDSELNPGTKSS